MMNLLWLFEGWNGFSVENFGEQPTEMRRLSFVEPSAAILGRKAPRIRRFAHKAAGRLVIAKVEEIHHDDFVDDGADLARNLRALHLEAVLDEAVEVVGDLFEVDAEAHILLTHWLQLVQPHQHPARMQAVNAAQVLGAGALRTRLWLLFGRTKREPTNGGDAVDEDRVVTVEVFQRPSGRLVVRLGVAAGRGQ